MSVTKDHSGARGTQWRGLEGRHEVSWGGLWMGVSSDKPSPCPHLWILGVGTGGRRMTGVDGGS